MTRSFVKYSSVLADFKWIRANGMCGSKFNPQKYRRGKRAGKKNVMRETDSVSAIYEYEILTQFHRRQPNEIKKKEPIYSHRFQRHCEMNRESVRCDKSANERKRNCPVVATSNKTLSANFI